MRLSGEKAIVRIGPSALLAAFFATSKSVSEFFFSASAVSSAAFTFTAASVPCFSEFFVSSNSCPVLDLTISARLNSFSAVTRAFDAVMTLPMACLIFSGASVVILS